MTAADVMMALWSAGAEVFLSAAGAVKLRNAGAVPAELRDEARAHREAIAAALRTEADEREAALRENPRERMRALGAGHPGGLFGRFGSRAAGEILAACHAWENALDERAAAALAAFNGLADRHLRAIE